MTNTIRRAREELELSQTELSRLVKIAQPLMSMVETGDIKPWSGLALRLSDILRKPVGELFPGAVLNHIIKVEFPPSNKGRRMPILSP